MDILIGGLVAMLVVIAGYFYGKHVGHKETDAEWAAREVAADKAANQIDRETEKELQIIRSRPQGGYSVESVNDFLKRNKKPPN